MSADCYVTVCYLVWVSVTLTELNIFLLIIIVSLFTRLAYDRHIIDRRVWNGKRAARSTLFILRSYLIHFCILLQIFTSNQMRQKNVSAIS